MPRYWTLEEARGALREVITLLTELQELFGEQPPVQLAQPSGNGAGPSANGHGTANPASTQEDRARRVIERLDDMGVQIKDAHTGLVDFPFLRGDEEVLLCYRLGEADIEYWHDLYGGFAGRRPLSEL